MKDENNSLPDEYLRYSKFLPELSTANFYRGTHFPLEKCTCNRIIFLLEGEVLVNSEEYPGTTLTRGNAILQAIGSKVELLALCSIKMIEFRFIELPEFCADQMRTVLSQADTPLVYTPLPIIPKLRQFLLDYEDSMRLLPDSECTLYGKLKVKELMLLLLYCYPMRQISNFFFPITTYTKSFQYFVMQHYEQAKNVEDLAHMGGYSINTFRRLFRNMYNMPVYEWMLQRKRERVLHDLHYTTDRISDISRRYGFETLSHFAHFCKDSFGDTPRSLRKRLAAGEVFTITPRPRNEQEANETEAD